MGAVLCCALVIVGLLVRTQDPLDAHACVCGWWGFPCVCACACVRGCVFLIQGIHCSGRVLGPLLWVAVVGGGR